MLVFMLPKYDERIASMIDNVVLALFALALLVVTQLWGHIAGPSLCDTAIVYTGLRRSGVSYCVALHNCS